VPIDQLYRNLWIANSAVWALSSAVLALILLKLYRIQRQPFLASWAGSFFAFGIAQLLGGVITRLLIDGSPDSLLRTVVSAASQIAYYLQAGLLLFGTLQLRTRSPLSRGARRELLVIAFAAGLLATVLTLGTDTSTRLLVRVGVRCLITGTVFVAAAVLVRSCVDRPRSLGARIVAGSFLAYGLLALYYGSCCLGAFNDWQLFDCTNYLGAVDTLAQCLVGFGLVIWALEQQHAVAAERTHQLAGKTLELLQVQKMEAVGRLAGGVAHDFNNMLTVIVGNSDLLLRQQALPHDCRRSVQEVRQAALQSAKLTAQLLTLSRNRQGPLRVLDLNLAVTEMADMLRRLIGENIRLETRIAATACKVRLPRGQAEQILLNLVVNACEAITGQGSVRIVTALATAPARTVVLSVQDDGAGMTPEVQAHAFEPFFTTKTGSNSGLGLSTVYGIVGQSDGQIALHSDPGRGTTVTIRWPEAPAPIDDPDTEPTPAATAPPRCTILLAEDDPLVRSVTARTLREAGFVVLEAADPGHAAATARTHAGAIDVLLSDVVMPGMNGPQLATRVQACQPDVQVLFMSGYVDDSAHVHLPAEAPLLPKPFSGQELLDFLGAHVRWSSDVV